MRRSTSPVRVAGLHRRLRRRERDLAARAREVAALQPRFVDGGIVGGAADASRGTTLYLSGDEAACGRGALRRLAARDAGRLERVRAEDDVRRVVEGDDGDAARDPRRRARDYGVEDELAARGARARRPAAARRGGQRRRRAGAGSARWRRSPTRSPPAGSRTASTARRPRCTARDPRPAASRSGSATGASSRASTSSSDGRLPARHRAERLGQDDAPPRPRAPRRARRPATLELPAREQIGYLGHSPNVYRELTALENLTLFARLYRVERERVGMLLERFGLWEVRNERVVDVLARHAAAARSLPRAPARPVAAPARRADERARRAGRSSCSTRCSTSRGCASSRRTTPRASTRARPRGSCSHDLRRRRRRARAQGSAARAAREGDAAVDVALRHLGADDLPLRPAGAGRATSQRAGCSGRRSSSPRCSA